MTIAQTKSAAKRIKNRYRGGRTNLSIRESIERERRKAAREARATKK